MWNVKKLLSGNEYEASIIDTKDSATRQIIGAHLLASLAGRNSDEHENARRVLWITATLMTLQAIKNRGLSRRRRAAQRKLGVLRDFRSMQHLMNHSTIVLRKCDELP